MGMLLYLPLAVVIYLILADRTDRAIDREVQKRRSDASDLGLVEDFDPRPDLSSRYGLRIRQLRHRSGQAAQDAAMKPVDHVRLGPPSDTA